MIYYICKQILKMFFIVLIPCQEKWDDPKQEFPPKT